MALDYIITKLLQLFSLPELLFSAINRKKMKQSIPAKDSVNKKDVRAKAKGHPNTDANTFNHPRR